MNSKTNPELRTKAGAIRRRKRIKFFLMLYGLVFSGVVAFCGVIYWLYKAFFDGVAL